MLPSSRVAVGLALMVAALMATTTRADAPAVARVGFVWISASSDSPQGLAELWGRLRTLGWEEGRNLVVERRSADGQVARLPALVADVLAQKVDIIVTASTPAALAARSVTRTVPIVAAAMGDPVAAGLAVSLARPGGNLTGLSYGFSDGFAGKWLELLRECVPQLKTVAVVYNPHNPWAAHQRKDIEATIAATGIRVHPVELTRAETLDRDFAQIRQKAQGLIIVVDPLTYHLRKEIALLAMRHRLPMMASMLEFVDAGGLLSYGVDNIAVFRRMADYVDKILRGAKPEDLPIEQPTELVLAVNLQTAAALGIRVPSALLSRADKVVR